MRNRLYRCFHPLNEEENEYPCWPPVNRQREQLAETTLEFVNSLERIYEYDEAVCVRLDAIYKAALNGLTMPPFDPAEHGGEG